MSMTRRHFIGATATAAAAAAFSSSSPAQTQKLRACIIGNTKQGGYGHSMHLVFGYNPDIEVVGLADPDEAGRASHAAEAKALRQYADYREMLEKEKPDLLAIAPRTLVNHREYMLAAAACGAHGIIEKPLAADLAQADEIIAATEKKGLAWAIGFNFRVTPVVEHVRRMVMEEGLIGEVLEMRGRGKEDQRAGGEDLLVLGVHVFDLMRYFAGNPRWCSGDVTVDGRPAAKADAHEATEPIGLVMGDRINAMFGFDKGITGYFATTRSAEGNGGRWGLDIYGSKGVACLHMNGSASSAYFANPAWVGTKEPVAWQPIPNTPPDTLTPYPEKRYIPIIDDMLLAAKEGRKPSVSIQDGRAALEMAHAIYQSHLQNARVALPLGKRQHPLAT